MAGKYQKKRQPKKRILPVWLLLLLVLLTTGGIGTAVAKFIQSTTGQTLFKAPEFYFTSDLLSTENPHYVLNSAVDHVTFTLRNSADALRVSEVSIDYTVTVDNGASVKHKPGITDTVAISKTLPKNQRTEVTYELSGLRSGITYTVTAKGAAGYNQTLQATFTISDKDENVHKHLEVSRDGYMILTVWTHNVSGTLSVNFPDELIPDNTNVDMESVYNKDDGDASDGEDASFEVEDFGEYASQTYRFFYNDGTYSVQDFFVSISRNNDIYLAEPADLP